MGVADERHLSLRGKLHLTLRLPLRERDLFKTSLAVWGGKP
jgi:hypothetical protein